MTSQYIMRITAALRRGQLIVDMRHNEKRVGGNTWMYANPSAWDELRLGLLNQIAQGAS